MDFFSKYDQICRKLRICSHLLKKSLMENFIFCAVEREQKLVIYRHEKESSKGVLMQILPVKVKTTDERTTTTYALLDNGNQSTLIRDDCAQGSKLKGYKKTVSVSSVIDKVWGVTSEENSKGRNISDASTRLWNNRLCNCSNFAVKKEARDNLLKSVTSEEEAVSLIKEMVDLLKAGEFVSIDEKVMKLLQRLKKPNHYKVQALIMIQKNRWDKFHI